MNQLDIQIASDSKKIPISDDFQTWVDCVLTSSNETIEMVIRIVDDAESAALNFQYRHKNTSTNILSFPFDAPDYVESNLLGDLIICAPVIESQAVAQQKILLNHWAHIVIHGVLHLCGYDHIDEKDAMEMEQKEINLLKKLHINNPYQEI